MKHKKLWKMGISIITVAALIGTVVCYTLASTIYASDTVYVDEAYISSGDESLWSKTGNGTHSWQTDEQGNGFIQFDYENPSGEAPTYYEFGHKFADKKVSSGTVVCEADMQFSNGDEGIYVKARDSGVNSIAARLRNIGGVLYYFSNGQRYSLYEPDSNNRSKVETGKWYHIQFVIHLDSEQDKSYSILVRDEEQIIGEATRVALSSDVSYVNLFSVGASSTMRVDNFKVSVPTIGAITVMGNPYPKRGQSCQYASYLTNREGKLIERADTAWSVEPSASGVTVSENGRLSVSASAQPASIFVVARSKENTNYMMKYSVDIEK
jgi:hypothetical protein